ncbi:hypothetical protein UlMin_024605 [Ulmus minor]
MDSKLVHDQHTGKSRVVEGEDEQHHEKRSVFTKVKDRARKIKDTITKHGHDQEHDDPNQHHHEGDHDLDEEDDDDEVEGRVADPEIHGAPVYDSSAVRKPTPANTPVSSLSDHTRDTQDSGSITGLESNQKIPQAHNPTAASKYQTKGGTGFTGDHQNMDTDPRKTFVPGSNFQVNLGSPKGLEEDPRAPNKDFDPTGAGAREAEVNPIRDSLDKMNIHDESEQKSHQKEPFSSGKYSTGSQDQFSPEPFSHKPNSTTQFPQTILETVIDKKLETKPRDSVTEPLTSHTTPHNPSPIRQNVDTTLPESYPNESTAAKSPTPSSYTEKFSSATSGLSDKAIFAKNAVASKLGYGEKPETAEKQTAHEKSSGNTTEKSRESETGYGKKTGATVTEKPSTVYEKVAGAGSTLLSKVQGKTSGDIQSETTDSTEKPSTVHEKVAGAGSTDSTEKPSTVYEKVAGAGSTLLSKAQGKTSGDNQSETTDSTTNKGKDKGISVSVKDYFSEKLKPGDEDKALSEVISESLRERKPETPEKKTESPPVDRVRESKEVARQLGTGNEGTEVKEDSNVVQKSIVETVTGSVGSWFGYGGDQSQNQHSPVSQDKQVDESNYGRSQTGHKTGVEERSL